MIDGREYDERQIKPTLVVLGQLGRVAAPGTVGLASAMQSCKWLITFFFDKMRGDNLSEVRSCTSLDGLTFCSTR